MVIRRFAATEVGLSGRVGFGSSLLAATGPITCIGLGLMLYNTLRFDNPLEFGMHYQLSLGPNDHAA